MLFCGDVQEVAQWLSVRVYQRHKSLRALIPESRFLPGVGKSTSSPVTVQTLSQWILLERDRWSSLRSGWTSFPSTWPHGWRYSLTFPTEYRPLSQTISGLIITKTTPFTAFNTKLVGDLKACGAQAAYLLQDYRSTMGTTHYRCFLEFRRQGWCLSGFCR